MTQNVKYKSAVLTEWKLLVVKAAATVLEMKISEA